MRHILSRWFAVTLIAVVASCGGGGATDSGNGVDASDAAGSHDVSVDVPSDLAADAPADVLAEANCATPDRDHDNHCAIGCGPTCDDCDDNDPMRFPGNPEVCAFDAAHSIRINPGHDEDCNPTTFANLATHDGDHDGDGYIDVACANTDSNGMTFRGNDCADIAPVAAIPPSLGTVVQPGAIHPMQMEACNGVDDNCDAQIDEGNPGGGASCTVTAPNVCGTGVTYCMMGALTCVGTPAHCCVGFDDCDFVAANGCEADLSASLNNCGSCGAACAALYGTPVCSAGVCGYSTCNAGRTLCGAACPNVQTDPNNCGTCSNVCPGVANGTPACMSGVCAIRCAGGYVLSAGACVPVPAPRLVAPLSTATVTSQTPMLRWALPAGASGALIDICRDRACANNVTTFSASGNSATSSTVLSAGLYYWRARSVANNGMGAMISSVWEFWVGARDAAVNTAWGTTLDVNGDGSADIAVGAYLFNNFTGHVFVYHGGSSGIGTTPAATLTGPDGTQGEFGYAAASAGDVNGDGYADLVVSAPAVNTNVGRVYVYLGGATGIGSTPATVLTGLDGQNAWFGASVASAGDIDGDGYGDLVVGAYGAGGFAGRAYVYLGGPTGTRTTPSAMLSGTDGAGGWFGSSVASAGDLNGDGYGDVVIGASGAMTFTGRAYVYLGSATGIGTGPSVSLTGLDGTNSEFGLSVASAGDVNADGYADLAVGAPRANSYTGAAYVYLGGSSGIGITPDIGLAGRDGVNAQFGWPLASAGDVNGDGFADLAIGAPQVGAYQGRVYVWHGGASGIASAPVTTLPGPWGAGGYFGNALAGAGDVNADGYMDLVVGAYGENSATGGAYVFLGGTSGIRATATTILTGRDGTGASFGNSVARVGIPTRGRSARALEHPTRPRGHDPLSTRIPATIRRIIRAV